MNRERLKELLPIMQAYADGKEIQFLNFGNQWCDCGATNPRWADGVEYRVKPEPINVKLWGIYNGDGGLFYSSLKEEGVDRYLRTLHRNHPLNTYYKVELTGSYER